jgi:hypothetical protein
MTCMCPAADAQNMQNRDAIMQGWLCIKASRMLRNEHLASILRNISVGQRHALELRDALPACRHHHYSGSRCDHTSVNA